MPKESVMLCIGTLTPEHWAYVPLILDILRNSIVLFCLFCFLFLYFFVFFHIGKDVSCCATCDYVTNIPFIASFYCCKNCVAVD